MVFRYVFHNTHIKPQRLDKVLDIIDTMETTAYRKVQLRLHLVYLCKIRDQLINYEKKTPTKDLCVCKEMDR